LNPPRFPLHPCVPPFPFSQRIGLFSPSSVMARLSDRLIDNGQAFLHLSPFLFFSSGPEDCYPGRTVERPEAVWLLLSFSVSRIFPFFLLKMRPPPRLERQHQHSPFLFSARKKRSSFFPFLLIFHSWVGRVFPPNTWDMDF